MHFQAWASTGAFSGYQEVILDANKSTAATATTDPVPFVAAQTATSAGIVFTGNTLSDSGLLVALANPSYLVWGFGELQPPSSGPVTGLAFNVTAFPTTYPSNWSVLGSFGNGIPTVSGSGQATALLRSTAGQPTLIDLAPGASSPVYTPVGDSSWVIDGKVSANHRNEAAFRTLGPDPGYAPGLLRIAIESADRSTTTVLTDGNVLSNFNGTGGRAVSLNDSDEVLFGVEGTTVAGGSLWTVGRDGVPVNVWMQNFSDTTLQVTDPNGGAPVNLATLGWANGGHTPPQVEDAHNAKGTVLTGLANVLVLARPVAGLRASNPLMPTNQDPSTGLMTFTAPCASLYAAQNWISPSTGSPTAVYSGPCYVDPPAVQGYAFTAANGADNFQSVIVPVPLPGGQSSFQVTYGNATATLVAGQTYTFPAGGVASFMILGINAAEALVATDPHAFVAGLAWVHGGSSPTSFTMQPLTDTGPTITPVITGTLGSNGWYTSNVSVSWTVADVLAPVINQTGCGTTSITVDTAGQNLTCTASSVGGTKSQSVTVKRDATAPAATATAAPVPNGNGWNSSSVTVTFSGSDATSGIASCTPAATMAAEAAGQASALGTCTDNAGNVSAAVKASGINIDKTAPVVTATPTPAPNAAGWNNTAVTVTYSGSDALSGVPANGCDVPTVLATDGAAQSATGHCTDRAGNTGSATANGINVDQAAPIASAQRSPAANAYGWNNSPVTVTFSGTDALSGSGIASCQAPLVFNEGAGQGASGTCVDRAGNVSAPAVVTGINVDLTAPGVSLVVPADGALVTYGAVVNANYSCTDGLAGIAQCAGTVANGAVIDTQAGGAKTFTATATDKAGNSTSATAHYTVVTLPVIVPTVTGTRGSNGWYTSDITVSWTVTSPYAPITATSGCGTTVVTRDTGLVTFTCTATNAAGTTSGTVSLRRSGHRPYLDVDEPRRGKTYTVGQSVQAHYECDDFVSGVATCSGTVASGQALDTSSAGNKSFTVTATNAAGVSRAVTYSYKVQ